jgi:hypothetical protein
MKRNLFFVAVVSVIAICGLVTATHPTQELVFPHLVVGGGWECEITIMAQGSENSFGGIAFYDQAGQPLEIEMQGGMHSHFGYNLNHRSAQTFHLSRGGPARVGYAVVSQMVLDGNSQGSINGFLSYRYRSHGRVVHQIGVLSSPALYDADIPFDNTNGNQSALALLSMTGNPVTVTRHTLEGTLLEEQTIPFDNFTQSAKYIEELFPASKNERGMIRIRSENTFQVLAMNQNGPILSTCPNFPGVMERELVLHFSETTEWILRLISHGDLLLGIAQSQDSTLPILVTGALQNGKLYLGIHTFVPGSDDGLEILLMADSEDRLLDLTGIAVGIRGVGSIWDSGTFELNPLPDTT